MKLIVAEKPSMAAAIAKALNITSKQAGFYSSQTYRISWSFGHLIKLAMPAAYDPALKSWRKETLPIIPDPFKLHLSEDPGQIKQFQILKTLIHEADQVFCATDNDREGDLIFHYIYKHAGANKPYHRILPNSTTPAGILKALEQPIPQRDHVIASAQSRSEADFLIGINATRALSIAAGRKVTIGRVQTPTLSIICLRYLQFVNFKPSIYYPVLIDLTKGNTTFSAKLTSSQSSQEDATRITGTLQKHSRCTSAEHIEVTEQTPLPYYLSSLQQNANTQLGFTLQKTLDTAQALYERHHITSYPRTDSPYLTTDLYPELPNRIQAIYDLNFIVQQPSIDLESLPKRCIDDHKAPNHHAIIPTDDLSAYPKLSSDERKLFELISLRFLAAFSTPCIKNKTKYLFDNSGHEFVTHGSVITVQGWRNIVTSTDDNDDSEATPLPMVSEQELVDTLNPRNEKKQTKPQPILTDTTLSKLMKAAGKDINDDELRAAMEKNDLRDGGLGTEATRAGIVENLIKVQLIKRDSRKIIPTEIGLSLYELIKDKEISAPILTAKWEEKLNTMAKGQYDRQTFMKEIANYTHMVTKQMLEIGGRLDTDPLKLSCPKCKDGNLREFSKGYSCSNYKREEQPCSFSVWKIILGKKITHGMLQDIVNNGATKDLIRGFKSEKGSFDARLVLDTETYKLQFSTDALNKAGEKLLCPVCKGGLRMSQHGAFCRSCEFKVWRNIAGKQLTDSHLSALVTKGKTSLIKGFVSSKGKTFDAALFVNSEHKIEFTFDQKKSRSRKRSKTKY